MSYTIDERNPERQQLLARMVDELKRLEENPTSMLVKFPDVWAIARR